MPLPISMTLDVLIPLAKMPSSFFPNWWTTYSLRPIQLYVIATHHYAFTLLATNSFYVTWLHYTFIVNKANSKLYDIEENGFILFVISQLIPNIVFST